ncbi:YitT family protein [Paenibacillus sp. GSMTC-2017]|uniref:YitT family protein n=1 Tax=Paenibacillus sp. GSMTC-2017 TaxID=2794350 RepID=UPI0018D73784|nr:YitT family protein [Paenibacillus sp. GSMTC-2017]MBH5320640.1 YitT family protein [Paenibacillus sp. GSMTC-2017]
MGKVAEVKVKRRDSIKPKDPKARAVWNLLLVLLGSVIVALSFNMFLVPNGIASGGVSGISILIQKVLGIMPALTQWALNIPLFIAGVIILGKKFGAKTALGTVLLPFIVLLTANVPIPTENPLLASIYGGIGVGLGLGLVFRGGGSTGGLDLAAQLLHRLTGIPYSLAVVVFDGGVIIAAGFVFSPEVSLYALIGLFVTSKTIDFVENGLQLSKVAFIISDHTEEVAEAILHDLDRGLTRLDGHGGFTGEGRTVLMVVVGQNEVYKLKQLVRSIDGNAFVIISNTAEVLGHGFKLEH